MPDRPDPGASVDADALRHKPGRPRRELYVLIGRQLGGIVAVRAGLAEHLAYLRDLDERGHLILAGPTLTERGARYGGDGCLLIAAADIDEAERIAAADPYQIHGARLYAVVPWLVSEGALFDALGADSSTRSIRHQKSPE